jgi:acyl carrier protein
MIPDVEQKIIDIIAEEAQIDRTLLRAESTMDDFDIPSITQFEVLFAIEEAFGVELPDEPEDLTLRGLARRVEALVEARDSPG